MVLTDKEIKKENKVVKDRIKHELIPTKRSCPVCGTYPLEQQIFLTERVIFCPHCEYIETQEM